MWRGDVLIGYKYYHKNSSYPFPLQPLHNQLLTMLSIPDHSSMPRCIHIPGSIDIRRKTVSPMIAIRQAEKRPRSDERPHDHIDREAFAVFPVLGVLSHPHAASLCQPDRLALSAAI